MKSTSLHFLIYNDEIEKFMVCQELTNIIYLEDSPLIDGNFSHRNDTQKQGIRSMIFMTIIQNCYNNIFFLAYYIEI